MVRPLFSVGRSPRPGWFLPYFNNFNQKVCSSGVSCRPQIDSNATLRFVSTRIPFRLISKLIIIREIIFVIVFFFFFFRFFDISSIIFSFDYLIGDWVSKKRRKEKLVLIYSYFFSYHVYMWYFIDIWKIKIVKFIRYFHKSSRDSTNGVNAGVLSGRAKLELATCFAVS